MGPSDTFTAPLYTLGARSLATRLQSVFDLILIYTTLFHLINRHILTWAYGKGWLPESSAYGESYRKYRSFETRGRREFHDQGEDVRNSITN
jgi:hypothetical protein